METLKVDYAIVGGNKMFDPILVLAEAIAIQVIFSGIVANNVKIEFYQSVTGTKPDLISDITRTIPIGGESIVVNLAGICPGTFIHIKVISGAEVSPDAKVETIYANVE